MKKALLFAGSVLLFAACTEKGFDVTLRAEGGDTTYEATPESPRLRTVMMEEFTGVTCPNCPAGHERIAALQAQNPGRLLAVSYYAYDIGQAEPVDGMTREDFRTTEATSLNSTIFTVGGLPSAGIDRVPVNGQPYIFQNSWPGVVAARMAMASPVNITVNSDWQEGDRTAVIRVRVAYTSEVAKKQSLTVLLTENDLVDAQESIDSTGNPIVLPSYTFKHVLRDVITAPVTGEPMLNDVPVKKAGRVYERTFVYPVSDKWKADKCTIIAFVHNAESGDSEVLQAAEAKLVD